MRRLFAFALVATALLTAGCKEDDPTTPEKGRTYLHIVDAVVADTFDLTFDYFNGDDRVISDFVFLRNFPIVGYADIEASGTPDEFGNGKLFLTASRQPFINLPPDTLMPPREIELAKDEKNTLVLADSGGTVRFLKIKDPEITYPSDTSAAVRFINVSNFHATASLGSADGAISIPNINFWNHSSFVYFPHGQYDLELRDANGAVLMTIPLWLGGRNAYSFFAVDNSMAYFNN
jgi:hypothetical protein